MANKKYANLFYFYMINSIGGIESWYYYISKKFADLDITIAYTQADPIQLERLSKRVRCIKWIPGTPIECERLFINFNLGILDYCKYDECIYFAHGDYKDALLRKQVQLNELLTIARDKRINKVMGVSQVVCDSWEELTGQPMELCYNPIEIDKPKKLIKIASAQRMTQEKGLNRIIKLAEELDKYAKRNDCLWQWDIYTNSDAKPNIDNIFYRKPTLDIISYLPQYNWFAILSDNEGFGYGPVEAVELGIPLITTPCPVFKEIGINEINSLTLEFDCSNIEKIVDNIFNKKLNFKYQPPQSNFKNILINKPSTYQNELKEMQYVKALKEFETVLDVEVGRCRVEGEQWFTEIDRCNQLLNYDPPLITILSNPYRKGKNEAKE